MVLEGSYRGLGARDLPDLHLGVCKGFFYDKGLQDFTLYCFGVVRIVVGFLLLYLGKVLKVRCTREWICFCHVHWSPLGLFRRSATYTAELHARPSEIRSPQLY